MWDVSPSSTSRPGSLWVSRATRLAMVPLGRNSAASFPNKCAASSSSPRTVGSSPKTSSPTWARGMASRIASVGLVTVSLLRSMISWASAPRPRERPPSRGPPPSGRPGVLWGRRPELRAVPPLSNSVAKYDPYRHATQQVLFLQFPPNAWGDGVANDDAVSDRAVHDVDGPNDERQPVRMVIVHR